MRIVLVYKEAQYLEILNLTPEEEKKYNEGISYDDFSADDYNIVSEIVRDRGAQIDDFDPFYFVVDDKIPVFDETHQEEPLMTI